MFWRHWTEFIVWKCKRITSHLVCHDAYNFHSSPVILFVPLLSKQLVFTRLWCKLACNNSAYNCEQLIVVSIDHDDVNDDVNNKSMPYELDSVLCIHRWESSKSGTAKNIYIYISLTIVAYPKCFHININKNHHHSMILMKMVIIT